jgi:biotin operon repressor
VNRNPTSVDSAMHPAVALLSEDRDRISYRPKLNELTGGVLPTIMLQQILYWWAKSGRKPFYKFFAPCEHNDYRPGDSWQEELGFSRTEIENSLKRLGTKIKSGVSKTKSLENNIIIWWTDRTRKTFYQVNEALLEERLSEIYLCNVENPHYIEMQDSRNTSIEAETNSRDSDLQSGEPAKTPDTPEPEEPKKKEKPKAQTNGRYAVAFLVDRIKEVRERGAKPPPLTNRQRGEYGEFFDQAMKDGESVADGEMALRWLVAKACGEVENEPEAWAYYGSAQRAVRDGWRPPRYLRAVSNPEEDARREREWAEIEAMTADLLKDIG